MSEDRGDELTREQLEEANRDLKAMLLTSIEREQKWKRKYFDTRKHLRIANKALVVRSMTVELLSHRLCHSAQATDRKSDSTA
jgi:hypothetical protein